MDEAGSCAGAGGFRPGVDSLDEPPNSRIFLVISKYTPESVLRERFSPFGEIQDIWVVRDKHTKESKGIAFVKFARSSQACRAMEEMHGQCLSPNDTKPIKVRVPGSGARGGCVVGRWVSPASFTRNCQDGVGILHPLPGAALAAAGIPGAVRGNDSLGERCFKILRGQGRIGAYGEYTRPWGSAGSCGHSGCRAAVARGPASAVTNPELRVPRPISRPSPALRTFLIRLSQTPRFAMHKNIVILLFLRLWGSTT